MKKENKVNKVNKEMAKAIYGDPKDKTLKDSNLELANEFGAVEYNPSASPYVTANLVQMANEQMLMDLEHSPQEKVRSEEL